MAAAISPFYEPTEPSQPMMSDDVSDEDRPQHRELRPLLFSNSVWVSFLKMRLIRKIKQSLNEDEYVMKNHHHHHGHCYY